MSTTTDQQVGEQSVPLRSKSQATESNWMHVDLTKTVTDDPLKYKTSTESQRLLSQCQTFFQNNYIKTLPRHCVRMQHAIHFTENDLLPRLQLIYGTSEFFFRCFLK